MSVERKDYPSKFLLIFPEDTTSEAASRAAAKVATLSGKNIKYKLNGEIYLMDYIQANKRYPNQSRINSKI